MAKAPLSPAALGSVATANGPLWGSLAGLDPVIGDPACRHLQILAWEGKLISSSHAEMKTQGA